MGQKSHPILLRLEKTNQQWNSCWYNDCNYTAQLLDDHVVRTYIQNCSQQLKRISPSFFIKRFRGQMQILLFFSPFAYEGFPRIFSKKKNRREWDHAKSQKFRVKKLLQDGIFPFGINNRKHSYVRFPSRTSSTSSVLFSNNVESKSLVYTKGVTTPFLQKEGNHLSSATRNQGNQKNFIGETVRYACVLKRGVLLGSLGFFHPQEGQSVSSPYLLKAGFSFLDQKPFSKWKRVSQNSRRFTRSGQVLRGKVRNQYTTNMEDSIRAQLGIGCKLHLLRCRSIYQNPIFLTSQIVNILQERISFRRFKNQLIEKISENATIKGVRIMCSGRVTARSKKAQKARTESIQWGCTGLNVFSELVHFASKKAQTAFGTIGVKVWICYKKPQHAQHETLSLGL